MYGPASIAIDTLHSNYVRFSVLAVSSIFFLVDPFAAIPAFLAMTFALAGKLIFRMFGITLPAFEIAGGVILLLIGIDMIEARRSPTQESSDETAEAAAKEDAGIVPLGIPMLAGPGAISSVMILVGQALKPWELMVVMAAIVLTAGLSYLILNGANRVRGLMGETGIRILVRIMGLLLVALAVQFFINGLTDLGLINKFE
jgi:multiple antibiotic resistance protein